MSYISIGGDTGVPGSSYDIVRCELTEKSNGKWRIELRYESGTNQGKCVPNYQGRLFVERGESVSHVCNRARELARETLEGEQLVNALSAIEDVYDEWEGD